MPIYFYTNTDEYGYLSNFSTHGFDLDGLYWPTSEHYFQAQKFVQTDPPYAEQIRLAKAPRQAKTLGLSREHPIRPDWEEVKDEVMRKAVLKTFQTHTSLREKLLATGDETLIENAPADYYWGADKISWGRF